MQWFRWWHGTVNDPKFSWVARKAETNVATVIAVWAALLEHASQSEERGAVGGFDPESYDCTLGLEDGTCQRVIDAMRSKGLLEVDRVAMWSARQPQREDNSTERVRRYRDKKKSDETQCNAEVTQGNAPDKIRLDKKEEQREGAARPARKAPPDFQPDRDYAIREIPDLDVDREIQKFRDWEFKNARKDWPACWRTWIANARDRGQYAKRKQSQIFGEAL